MIPDGLEDLLKQRGRRRGDREPRVAGVFPAMADANIVQLKLSAERDDLVENFRKQEAVDDVTGNLNFFRKHCGAGRGHAGLPSALAHGLATLRRAGDARRAD